MGKHETDLTNECIGWLRHFPDVVVRKRHITVYGSGGDPDVYGCFNGWHFEVEIKIYPNVPTKRQEERLKEWDSAYALTGVAYSFEDFQRIFQPAITRMQNAGGTIPMKARRGIYADERVAVIRMAEERKK